MYLQEFTANGSLNHEVAEQISWKTADYAPRIHLVANGHRTNSHCLPFCWDELRIRDGTPISITVDGGIDGADDTAERRALVEVVDYIERMTAPDPPNRRFGRTKRRFWQARG